MNKDGTLQQSGNRAIGQGSIVGSNFRQMAVCKESQGFAERVAEFLARLSRDPTASAISAQLIRSAGSIAANVAEGYGRFSQAAYRNHLSIARGSAFESESWLDLLIRRHYITNEQGEELLALSSNVQKMLTTRMRALSEAKQTYAKEEGATYEV